MEKDTDLKNELDEVAIERATSIYAMEFIKRQAVEETKLRIQTGLLDDILNKNYQDTQFIIDQGAKLDYDLTLPQSVFHLTFANYSQIDMQKLDQLFYITEHLLLKENKQHIIQTKLQSIVFLTDILGSNNDEYVEYAVQIAKDLEKEWITHYPNEPIVIGIGHTYQSIELLSKSAEEAQDAVILRELNKVNQYIIHYRNLGMYNLLLKMHRKNIDLTTVYDSHINRLFTEPNKMVDLIYTITVFFEQNQSIKKTSDQLFIHRHTLRYRLNQIEKKTRLNLKDTDDIFKLQFALKAYKLNKILLQKKSKEKPKNNSDD